MVARWFPCLAVCWVSAVFGPLQAAEAKKVQPAVLVKIRSLDAVMEDGEFLAGLAGYEERAKQFRGIIKGRIDEHGLEGIDTKRPLGIYNRDLFDLPPVFMVPIADEKTFLKLLKNFRLKATKDDKGIYTVPIDFLRVEIEAYFRLANGYAYITAQNAGALADARLLPPAALQLAEKSVVASATLFLDHISKDSKDLAVSELERQVKRLQQRKPPRETEAEEKIRVQFLKDLAANIAQFIREGHELGVRFEVEPKAQKLALTLRLTGQPDSKLSGEIAALGQTPSLFAGLVKDNSAGSLLVHFAVAQKLRKIIEPMIEDRLKDIQEKEQDKEKHKLVTNFIKAITPSLKSGEVDLLVSLRGPSEGGRYTVITALKLKEGQKIEKVVREVIASDATPETERKKIKFDAEKAGDLAIHRATIKENVDPAFKKTFGDAPLYFAFRDDALIMTLGEGSLEAMKEAATAKPKAGPLLQFDLALARLVPLMATSAKYAEAARAAKELFEEDSKDKGTIRVTLTGGKALTVRYRVSGAVVKFGIQAAKEAQKRLRQQREKAEQEAEKAQKAREEADQKRKEAEKKKEAEKQNKDKNN
jgi:hypothetical protein